MFQCSFHPPLLRFKFNPGASAPFYPDNHKGCIGGCDPNFLEFLQIRPLAGQTRSQSNAQPSNTSIANDTGNSSGYASGSQPSGYSNNSLRSNGSFVAPTAPPQRTSAQPRSTVSSNSNGARNTSGSDYGSAPPVSSFSGGSQRSFPPQSNSRPNDNRQPRPPPQRPEVNSR